MKNHDNINYSNIDKTLQNLVTGCFNYNKESNIIIFTGIGGVKQFKLTLSYTIFGNKKLPRKFKKRVYGNKKDRLKYIPEYYENNIRKI